MAVRCWHQDLTQRPNMTEVVRFLRKLLMVPLSMEADLRDFFEVCKTQGRDGQGEKAQEFADELDEVRHAERRNVHSSHHKSRHLTTLVFPRKNGTSTCGTRKSCVVTLSSFRPRSCSRKNLSNWRLTPLTRVVTRVCSKRPSRVVLLW